MLIRWLLPVFCCLALFGAGQAGAVTVAGLYDADLAVSAAAGEPTPEQATDGLAKVLVKLSGRSDVKTLPGYRQVIEQAQMLLNQYRYRTRPDGSAVLTLSYEQAPLDRLMDEAHISGPGPQRPALLLWFVVRTDAGTDYAAADNAALRDLLARAKARGLPVQQPLLDLQDQQQLPPQDLWNLAGDTLRKASDRYRPDAVLAGRLDARSGSANAEFELLYGSDQLQFSPSGTERQQMDEVLDKVADRLLGVSKRTAFDYHPHGLVLVVEGVASQADYLTLTSMLRQIDGVKSVFPERLSEGRLQLRLQLDTSVAQLQETLKLENRLVAIPRVGFGHQDDTNLLQYRWQP